MSVKSMRRLRVKPISCPPTSSLSIRTLTGWVVWTPRMTDSIWGNHKKLNEGSTNNKAMQYNRPKGNYVSPPPNVSSAAWEKMKWNVFTTSGVCFSSGPEEFFGPREHIDSLCTPRLVGAVRPLFRLPLTQWSENRCFRGATGLASSKQQNRL